MNARVAFLHSRCPAVLRDPRSRNPGSASKLPEFAALAEKASESVNVTLDAKLLGIAARFLSSDDPEQAAAKKLVAVAHRRVRPSLHVRHRYRLSQKRHRRCAPPAERSRLEPHRRGTEQERKHQCRRVRAHRRRKGAGPRRDRERTARIHHREHRGHIDLEAVCTTSKAISACRISEIRDRQEACAQPKP